CFRAMSRVFWLERVISLLVSFAHEHVLTLSHILSRRFGVKQVVYLTQDLLQTGLRDERNPAATVSPSTGGTVECPRQDRTESLALQRTGGNQIPAPVH